MRWYKRLFWKMFLVIWLVSLLGMSGVFLLVSNRYDQEHRLELLEARARGQATLMLERFEAGVANWHMLPGRHRPVPLWLYEGDSRMPLMPWLPEPPRKTLKLTLTTDSGREYRARVALPREAFHAERLLGRLFSLQMVLILIISALSGLVLGALVVRPIQRLREHVRELHQAQDLTLRADAGLSRRQDEIGELTREFDRLVGSVEQTLLAQQRLLQDVSHELRAPLARLQAAAGLIEQRLAPDDSMMDRINRECDRLDALIGEILSFSRQQRDQSATDFSLTELCLELQEEVRLRQPERRFSLELPSSEVCYHGVPELLRCALQNGIENILRHTSEQTAACLSVQPLADGRLLLRLSDAGPGVDPEVLPRLFEPFVRDEHAGGDGFGLGMSIARRAVRQLGGEISAHNRPEGGLELRLLLPPAG
ncbi:sensor histidine kinase [Marinobacterium sediminicola]|uniref:histidine kinase n=1 Tax=Marinobacterium sediminicola TaxID=518898 RepID=A0ABY1RZA3_9GAMM|nr:HAMP domain-containing sensor histidine kinase [Marinobacterium sediminicola]ULG69146.1 HAMP domain-containing histidine kinase [Marinobacterium sediminicola]SMR73573.1 Signal transduction histidine kinase [Marinobacterium sediminicola]